jgi:TPR repeat protein
MMTEIIRMTLLSLLLLGGFAFNAHAQSSDIEAKAQQYTKDGDWHAAREAFVEAAQLGSPTAMAYLGWIHEEGHGVAANDALAVIWYGQAVKAGADHLAVKLGWLHLSGSEAIRSRELSEQWFLYGIEQGDLDAHVALSSLLIADAQGGKNTHRLDQAREWLLKAHQGEHQVAKYFLARLYLEGIGGHPVDYDMAHHYTLLGAEEGHPQMQGWLAHIYKEGLGREPDPVEAAKWAILAAIGGDSVGSGIYATLEQELSESMMNTARQQAMDWAAR